MKLVSAQVKQSGDWVLQLINIVFLLLVFFVTNGTISNLRDGTIDLPSSAMTAAGGQLGDAAYVGLDGVVKFRGGVMQPAAIAVLLRAQATQAGAVYAPQLQIVADRRLLASQLIDIVRQFRAAGLENIGLITVRGVADGS